MTHSPDTTLQLNLLSLLWVQSIWKRTYPHAIFYQSSLVPIPCQPEDLLSIDDHAYYIIYNYQDLISTLVQMGGGGDLTR